MGPRIFIRGYYKGQLTKLSMTGFNGAADFHPRIHVSNSQSLPL